MIDSVYIPEKMLPPKGSLLGECDENYVEWLKGNREEYVDEFVN